MRRKVLILIVLAAILSPIIFICIPAWLINHNIAKRSAVMATYITLGITHGLEAMVTFPFSTEISQTHFLAAKLSFYSIYAFIQPEESPYHIRFDFHHLSYGLAMMLLPGDIGRFGKCLVFDEFVNYNFLGVFGRHCHFFLKSEGGIYTSGKPPPPHIEFIEGDRDGLIQVGMSVKGYRLFPVDNFFQKNWKELLFEISYKRHTPLLDLLSERMDWAIENLIEPYFLRTIKDRCPTPRIPAKIDIDFNLLRA